MMQSLFSKDMMKKVFCQGYLWLLLLLLYSPIFIIIIFSFTEAKVMGNWTGFSLQLYKNLFAEGTHHSLTAALVNTVTIALITATVSTLFGTLTAIGIYNLRNRYARNAIQFVNNIPILNGDIIIGISLFLLFITRAYHVVVFMTSLYLGKHHLIDVEGLVDDPDLLAGLLFIPFREVGKNVFIYVISPVVNFQNLLTVLFVVTRTEKKEKREK